MTLAQNRVLLLCGTALLLGTCTAFNFRLIPVRGTLVVMVPSSEGLVVAADSRSTVASTYCDVAYKIIEPSKPARTIVSVTGNGSFIQDPGAGVLNYCQYLQQTPRILDIEKVVRDYIESAGMDVANIRLDDLGNRCIESLKHFGREYPLAIQPFVGQEIFSVVLAGYNLGTKTAIVRSFVVRVLPSAMDFEVIKISQLVFKPNSPRDYAAFGETAYLDGQVFGGAGRKFISQETVAFLLDDKKTVSQTTLREAEAIATNIIEGAAQTTAIIPARSGIGGPVDVVLLGHGSRVRRLRWK